MRFPGKAVCGSELRDVEEGALHRNCVNGLAHMASNTLEMSKGKNNSEPFAGNLFSAGK